MILYHGTSTEYHKKILSEGLLPRSITGNSNWHGEVESKLEFVYLTTCYPIYYAVPSVKKGKNLLIVKVDISEKLLYPDEDFIARCLKVNSKQFENVTLKKITSTVNPKSYKRFWKESLKFNGNVCLHRVGKEQILDYRITYNFEYGRRCSSYSDEL